MFLLFASAAGADTDPRKASKAEAKRLAKLAQTAEKQGKLLEARSYYLQAEGNAADKSAEDGLKRVNDLVAAKVKTLLTTAGRAYQAKDFAQANELLESVLGMQPGNPTAAYDLALTKYQRGEHSAAVVLLDGYAASLHDGAQQERAAQLRSAMEMGLDSPSLAERFKPQLSGVNIQIAAMAGKEPDDDDEDAPANLAPAPGLCAALKQLQPASAGNPALLFDLAKCAEQEGRHDEAIVLFTQYNVMAPEAVDGDAVLLRIGLLKSLQELPEAAGKTVRALYARAQQDVDDRRYDRAIAAYREIETLAPQLADPKRKLAELLEAEGKTGEARAFWQSAMAAEASEDRKLQAQLMLDSLDKRQQDCKSLVAAAREPLVDLLQKVIWEGDLVGRPFAVYQFQAANEKLRAAGGLCPLTPELNNFKGFVFSQMNDFRAVRRSNDVLLSHKLPVSFYGVIYDRPFRDAKDKAGRPREYVKFEMEKDTVRIVRVALYNPKKHRTSPPASAAGQDKLGNFGTAEGLRGQTFDGFTLTAEGIKKLETRDGFILLELNDRKIKQRRLVIEPLHMALGLPPKGPGVRRYTNNYTRQFARYMGFDTAKLGKESMTTGEKLRMVYDFAMLANDAFGLMFDPIGAFDVAVDMRRVGMNISRMAKQADRLAVEQKQTIQGMPFKAVPAGAIDLAYRSEGQKK